MNELPSANEFIRALRDIINSKGSGVTTLAINSRIATEKSIELTTSAVYTALIL